MPTAETSPAGSVSFASYEIVILQVSYATSDRTQVTLTGTPPLSAEQLALLDISVKTVVVRESRVSMALMGSASGIFGAEEGNGFIGRMGAVVTLCEPAWTCKFGLSVATNLVLLGPYSVALSGVGGSARLGKLVSLVAEVDTAVPLGASLGQANGILGGAGVRLSKPNWGLDLGFFVGGKARADAGGAPWVVFTYRIL
jgi:hypothetical protein